MSFQNVPVVLRLVQIFSHLVTPVNVRDNYSVFSECSCGAQVGSGFFSFDICAPIL